MEKHGEAKVKQIDTSYERTGADSARYERRRAVREAEYAARWDAGWWRGRILRTESGDLYTVIYQGRRGGGSGPDFRDAVLARPDGTRVHGDVELHLRASGWHEHGHATDNKKLPQAAPFERQRSGGFCLGRKLSCRLCRREQERSDGGRWNRSHNRSRMRCCAPYSLPAHCPKRRPTP